VFSFGCHDNQSSAWNQYLEVTTKGSMDEIGYAVYEEMTFKVKVYGRTPDEKRSQKLTMSLCDR
jgi:hypothetical protein